MMLPGTDGFQTGLALGLASVASIGPNNLMMIREGLLGGRAMFVASLVWASYLGLILVTYLLGGSLAVLGTGTRCALTWLGLGALAWFALESFRAASAARPNVEQRHDAGESGLSCFARVMGVVWMNPLTYVELLLVPAALCQSFAARSARLEFIVALVLAAGLACYGYALGGRVMASILRHRSSLRLFDLTSGIILSAVAASVAFGLTEGVLQ
jgi:arginine exporter protein ArgO